MENGFDPAGISYITVDSGDNNSTDHQQPIGQRHIELTVKPLRRMDCFDVREVAQSHHLREQLEAGRDHGL